MYLKSLELQGFKSFAKKEVLNFNSEISAIVGPNGSGKSNVSEAFRFVLGEQSFKNMRSKKGEDLIYSGVSGSAKVNRASVKITFDNADRLFPLDYDEITLERIVYRDGVNEYLINGSKVRLKDIHELLANANVGSSGHHIISQGEADRILLSSPKERKNMLEDALGLRVYQYKKKESEKKLEKTEANIKEVKALQKEIVPHMNFLKKQVEKIQQAEELKKDLVILYKDYLKRESLYISSEKTKIESQKKEVGEKLADIEKTVQTIRNNSNSEVDNSFDSNYREIQSKIDQFQEDKNRTLRLLGELEGELRVLNNISEKQTSDTVSVYTDDIERLNRDLKMSFDEADKNVDVKDLKNTLFEIKSRIESFLSKYSGAKSNEDYTERISSIKNKIDELQNELKDLEKSEKEVLDQKNNLDIERREKESKRQNHDQEIIDVMNQKSKYEQEMSDILYKEKELNRDIEDYEKELQEARVLIGLDALNYDDLEVELEDKRDKQRDRQRDLERKKIKFEEISGGASDDVLREYKDVEERHKFLQNEIEDLETTSDKLRELIEDLDEKIESLFKEGMEKINKVFAEYFVLMFGGGSAKLSLVKMTNENPDEFSDEDEEIIEGLDISVSLPRKKTSSLMMLSGGEKALTSIALLFAMSSVNPPPFIILDETDAALDEANAKRYGDMLESLSKNSQLIVVTHNRETMSRASVLYGVTMQSGTSQLLSIKFEEGVEFAK